ncbi:MAG: hypothetical protein QM495_10455 [Lutibacter sp.]|uniref:OB-fold protein n=1 Tax=Lutibacter sp. TaxID=1925666 RepID=UPI00385DC485
MNRHKLKIIIGLFIIVIIISILGINKYNKPHLDVRTSNVAFTYTPTKLIKEYQKNEGIATKKLANKILQIEGDTYTISTLKGSSIITFNSEALASSVICHLQPQENTKILNLKKNQYITIRGICTGYLLDVLVVECVLVN